MEQISMILLAGGIGTRMKASVPKQFLPIGGKPIIVHVLDKLENIEEICEVVVPSPKDYIEQTMEIIRNYHFSKPVQVIEGGKTRQESVYKALKCVTQKSVLIHESVRPFVKKEEFEQLIHTWEKNATYGMDIPFTVLEGGDYIEKNLDRSRLINIQLPQKFDRKKLLAAHEQAAKDGKIFTEDVSLLFHYTRERIRVLRGTEYNIKITRPIDQALGEIIYKEYILGGE